jgi:amino acid transporter
MEQKSTLVRGLTLITVFTLIAGAMVGMAWAVLANVMLDRAGPAVGLSIVIAAVLSLFIGLCYAELCSAMPYAGGEYIYVKRGMGKFGGFFAGWILILAYASMMPGECIILGKLVHGIAPGLSPAWTGAVLALVFTIINLLGVRISGYVQLVLTLALFAGILIYVVGALPKLEWANYQPILGRGWGGVFLMVPLSMLAFMGYDILPQAAEEVNAPVRKMVFLIPASILFVAFFYFMVTVANAGLAPWEGLAKSEAHIPIMDVVTIALGEKGPMIILIAGIAGLITTMNAFMLGGSRLLMAMAKDGEIPSAFAYVHPRFHTPSVALLFLGIMGVIGSFFTELIVLFDTAASSVLVCYILVAVSLILLRRKEPNMDRPYKVWAYPLVPILAIISTIPAWGISMALLETHAIIVYFGWMAIGCLYFLIVRRGR